MPNIRTAEDFLKVPKWTELQSNHDTQIAEIEKKFQDEEDDIRARRADGRLSQLEASILRQEVDRRKEQALSDVNDQFGRSAVESVFAKDDSNSTLREQLRKMSKNHLKPEVQEAADLMGRVIDNLNYKPEKEVPRFTVVSSRGSKKARSEYDPIKNTLKVRTENNSNSSVFVSTAHEIAHWMESSMPELKKKMLELYSKITEGAPIPIPGHPGEFYRKATIPVPSNYYVKDYAASIEHVLNSKKHKNTPAHLKDAYRQEKKPIMESTELLSGFFEELLKNPTQLAKDYPEFFNQIMEILK